MSVLEHISFCPELAGHLGVEQEFFLQSRTSLSVGMIPPWGSSMTPAVVCVPRAQDFFKQIFWENMEGRWTYELSACQVEVRTEPHRDLPQLGVDLMIGKSLGQRTARSLGLELAALEVAPADMPLDVFPDERYLRLVQHMPKRVLRAACRVASVHVHYGCESIQHALSVYNKLVRRLDELCKMGDSSGGRRLELYKLVAQKWRPPIYDTIHDFERVADEQGFARDPRGCWHLIRISRYGTVEVRAFGNTHLIEKILDWAEVVRDIAER